MACGLSIPSVPTGLSEDSEVSSLKTLESERISRALRISRGGRRDNSGLEMAQSVQDDSVRSKVK